MNARAKVSVVVVSYQVRELLRTCLTSLRSQAGAVVEVFVVDNASRDGSADMVASEFPEVHLIANANNHGFARANNQALALATGEILLLLNPDTEMPPGGLAALAGVFARNPRAGAAGLALRGADGSPQRSCHSFPGPFNMVLEAIGLHRLAIRFGIGTPYEAPVPRSGEGAVDWVGGACMALSREAYTAVGGLDEESFMYGEEMDWSWRARERGLATVYSSAAVVLHHGEASGAGCRGELYVHNAVSRVRFLARYRGAWRAALARELITFGSALRLLYWAPRATWERGRGGMRPHTSDQLERFQAIMAWRRRRTP